MSARPDLRALAVILALLSFAGPVTAQDFLYDDGGTHVFGPNTLDGYSTQVPLVAEVRDGPGSAPTTLDVTMGETGHSLSFRAYGSSALDLLNLGYVYVYSYDDSTVLVEDGSFSSCSSCFEPISLRTDGRSTAIVRDSLTSGIARGESTVYFEPPSVVAFGPVVGNYYQAEENSTTIVLAGSQSSTSLYGSAVMTVFGGEIGFDSALVTDDAVLIVDGGSVASTYGFAVTGNGRADIHSAAENAVGAYQGGYAVADFGLLRLFGSDFTLDGAPLGPGDYDDIQGQLSGTLESGDLLNVEVSVATTATLRIVPEPGTGLLVAAGLTAALAGRRRNGSRFRRKAPTATRAAAASAPIAGSGTVVASTSSIRPSQLLQSGSAETSAASGVPFASAPVSRPAATCCTPNARGVPSSANPVPTIRGPSGLSRTIEPATSVPLRTVEPG